MDSIVSFLEQYPVLLALAIFSCRVCDVSLCTVRTITVVRGYRLISGCIGFIEVCIWLTAINQTLRHLNQWYTIVGYAGGFATGNMAGIWLESKIALGFQVVRAISRATEVHLAKALRDRGFRVTEVSGHGRDGVVKVLFIVVQRKEVHALIGVIEAADPGAFITVEDVRSSTRPIEPVIESESLFRRSWFNRSKRK